MLTSPYFPIIVATFFGFIILAFALLVPIYRFLKREEEVSKLWTEEVLAERMKQAASENRPPESVRRRRPQ